VSYSPVYAFAEERKRNTVTAAAQTSIGTTAGQALAASATGKGFWIVNTGATVIKGVLGTGTPTQTVYHFALKACSVADDGTGGVYVDDQWVGAVQIISDGAGGTCVIGRTS
jgi:hypothetical protein